MAEIENLKVKIAGLEQELAQANQNLTSAVSEQTRDLESQADFFRILYDISLNIANANNKSALLDKTVRPIKDMLKAQAVIVRLLDDKNRMILASSIGIEQNSLPPYKVKPAACLCSEVLKQKTVIQSWSDCECLRSGTETAKEKPVISAPIKHKHNIYGTYTILLNTASTSIPAHLHQLLSYIGANIGMALEKFKIEKQKRQSMVSEERVRIAHEIHDSLAQTIASLKLRAEILEKSINKNDKKNISNTMQRIKHGISQANLEIRELIRNFRASSEIHSLHSALENLVAQFRKDNKAYIYLQYQCNKLPLALDTKTYIFRIAQEALANITKHSKARFVRLMASCDEQKFNLLIEDDGLGFSLDQIKTDKGKHVGIKFMRERADIIGAKINIDSEAGEGCRVDLSIPLSSIESASNN